MTEHEACLARIDVLERELFPHWFPDEPKRELEKTKAFGDYGQALIRLSWKQDPKNGGLVPSKREAVPMNLSMSAVAVSPGAMWPVEAHNEAAPFVLLKNQLDKKRIILP